LCSPGDRGAIIRLAKSGQRTWCQGRIEIDPEYARAYNNRGFAYDNYGEFDKAIADYTRAIAIDPYYTTAYYNRGFAYRAKGEKNKSNSDFLVAGYTP